jgi:hypothetical protein
MFLRQAATSPPECNKRTEAHAFSCLDLSKSGLDLTISRPWGACEGTRQLLILAQSIPVFDKAQALSAFLTHLLVILM